MILPTDIQRDWMAQHFPATPTEKGVARLLKVERTSPRGYDSNRITVQVVDENGFPMRGVPVAFAYSTADFYALTPDFLWTPPSQRLFCVVTEGDGQIDQIQGSTVKQGEPGGVTVFLLIPEISSDVLTGAGMLADHTGLKLTFQVQRTGVRSIFERLDTIEAQLKTINEVLTIK